jgi:stage II sporulation protein D
VRVLLFESRAGCRVRVLGAYTICGPTGEVLAEGDELPWTDVTVDAERMIHIAGVSTPGANLAPASGATMDVVRLDAEKQEQLAFAGEIEFSTDDESRLRALNLVEVETYVAGVVPNEVWPQFHDEAFKGQAVAARTYALYLMGEHHARYFDVRAGEGDQVYRGVRDDDIGRRVRAAVNATHGVVLAWDSPSGTRVICAYYSAACGGKSQSLAELRPGADVPPPLRGGVECDFCKIAKGEAYRWKPREITKSALFAQLKTRDQAMASWGSLSAVEIARRTDAGRIAEVLLRGDAGQQKSMAGERFRLAVGSRVMRSTACDIVDEGEVIRFENGRGFGHGVGLCQWGMEGQAREGRRAGEILLMYYPGARLVRAY